MLRLGIINSLVLSWVLLSVLICFGWFTIFMVALRTASRRRHQGHWWGKYVLGLHDLLRPLYLMVFPHCPLLAKVLAFIYQCLTLPLGIELPLLTQVGKGLSLSHTSGVVVHAGAVIGDYCTLHSGVVLGGKGRQDPPVIGDNVYIGANAVIAGAIRVGNHATVGACALVTEDIPDGALAGSERARIIKERYERPYFNQGASCP